MRAVAIQKRKQAMGTVKLGGYTHGMLVQQVGDTSRSLQRLQEQMSKEMTLLLELHPTLQLSKAIMVLAQMQMQVVRQNDLIAELRNVVTSQRKRKSQSETDETWRALKDLQRQIDELKGKTPEA